MEDTDNIINEISNEEAIDKLDNLINLVNTTNDKLGKTGQSSDATTMATNVVAGHIIQVKKTLEDTANRVVKTEGTMAITNKSLDAMASRFAAKIEEITTEAEKGYTSSLEATKQESKELIQATQSQLEETFNNLVGEFKNNLDISSNKVQPVVLVSSQSVRSNDRLKTRDLYDAKTLSSGGGGGTDYSHARTPVFYDDGGAVFQGYEAVTYQNNAESSREIQDLTGAIVAGATVVAHTETETEHTILKDKTDDTLVLVEYPYVNGARQAATYTVVSTGAAFAGNVTDLIGPESDVSYDIGEIEPWHEGTTNYYKKAIYTFDESLGTQTETGAIWYDANGAVIAAPAAPIYGAYTAPSPVYDTPTLLVIPNSSTVNVTNWKSISVKGKGDAGVTVTVGAAVTTLDEDEELNWSLDDVSTQAIDITTTAATTARVMTVID